ncbi:hypothetical protein BJK06_08225 [Curtobacterium sp. BH-2-1-1]|nr:hypothetical protein BJK06_08225 [Curtobacterium sp. BH-2-1-1]
MPRFRKPLTDQQRALIARIHTSAVERERQATEYRRMLWELHLSGLSIRHVADEVPESPGTVFKWLHQERDRQGERTP